MLSSSTMAKTFSVVAPLILVYNTLYLSKFHYYNVNGMKVRVNGNLGEDSINCLNNSIPCKSLEHVFQFLNKPGNQTSDSHFEISIDQKIIHLAKRIRLIALDNYKVHLGPGQVGGMQLPESTIISNSNNAMIEIHPSSKATVIFRKLSFTNFGPNVPAAVLINGPISVTFEQCNFFDNHCSGLNVRDSNLVIRKSNFSDNLANQTNDFDINFSFGSTSLAGNLGIMFEMDGGYYVSIDTCRFERGRAYTNDNEYVISHDTGVKRILSNYYAIGGGVGIVHAFSSKRNTVNITKCHFESNSATYGGGLFLTFIHNTSYNKVFIGESVITKNNVSQTGGGILFSSWDNAHNNGAFFSDCEVSYNDAMGGGGMKIIYNNKDPNNPNQGGALEFQMRRCKIYTNTAMSGAAVRLLFNLPIGRIVPVLPKFVDCTFQGHKPSRNSREYPGAILSSRLSFELEGLNEFISNTKGSAIYMSYSSIHVKGALKFIKNHGRYGGAIYLADVSNIILYPSSSATFTRNQADFQGGALYVQATTLQETTYPYNPGCFVQYSIPKTKHSQWKTKVSFVNNSASLKGAAIFINSLVGCLWTENIPNYSKQKALKWDGLFSYADNYLLYEGALKPIKGSDVDIATDTYDFYISVPRKGFMVAPGEKFTLNISAIDQLGHTVYSIPSIKEIIKRNASDTNLVFAQQYAVVTPGKQKPQEISIRMPSTEVYHAAAEIQDEEYLEVAATYSNFLVKKRLIINTQKCHPGYKFNGRSCVCDTATPAIERCEGGRYVYLKTGYWGGMMNGKFVTNICPRGYCKCQKEAGKSGCLYDYQNPDDFCVAGRESILCGRCKPGLSIGLRATKCQDCSGTGWFFALSLLFLLIIALLIIYFNSNIPSDVRGILFYVQVVPFLFKPNDAVGDIVTAVSGFMDLGRATDYPFDTCACPGFGNLGTTMLNYTTPALVAFVLFIFYLCRRRLTLNRNRPFQCFLVLMILVYKNLVETSFLIVHCVNVGGKRVFFYDGSWECYQGFHLGFATVAWIVFVLFIFLPIPGIYLIVRGGARSIIVCDRVLLKIHQPVIDAISEGLRRYEVRRCSKCGGDLQRRRRRRPAEEIDVEDFCCKCCGRVEDCWKKFAQGQNECWTNYIGNERGWWWAVELTRRIVLVALYVFIQDWEIKQITLTIACAVIFALHCIAWPYNDKYPWANKIETVLLLSLVILANTQSLENDNTRHAVSIFILVVTYTFAVLFSAYKAARFFRKWYEKRKNGQQQRERMVSHESINTSL